MSNENDGKPPAPTQNDLNMDLGFSILRSSYGGGFGVNFQTGENISNHGGSIAREQAAQTEAKSGLEEAGKHFAMLKNQVLALEKKLADQAEETTWLRTQRVNSGKKSKSKKGSK